MLRQYGGDGHRQDGTEVGELVARARDGDQEAWAALVEQFRPLVRAVARGYRLTGSDVDDVGQTVLMLLVENVDRIREPRALPAWLVTTTRRESLRLIRQQRTTIPVDPFAFSGNAAAVTEGDLDSGLLRREEVRVLQQGLAELPLVQRELLLLLTGERVLSYSEISALLTMPVGSIGPNRARGLARLRATPAVRDYLFPASCDDHRQARPA